MRLGKDAALLVALADARNATSRSVNRRIWHLLRSQSRCLHFSLATKELRAQLPKESYVEAAQKDRIAALLAEVQVAILVTQGDQWPTATMQAFAETPELDLLFIMNDATEKFQNLLKHPHVTVFLDAREKGKVETFEISRLLIQGVASEIKRESGEWDAMKAVFLKKSPFEAPFFKFPTLRMMRVRPKRLSYAGADRVTFKADF
jgi:Pyridoxamine 5'-phosphate oxidase